MADKVFVGIADAHGIESFILEENATAQQQVIFSLRAGANRQRHAVAYRAMLSEEGVAIVEKQIEKKDFIGALHALKIQAKEVKVESDLHVKSWKMIPNPDLDPFHS